MTIVLVLVASALHCNLQDCSSSSDTREGGGGGGRVDVSMLQADIKCAGSGDRVTVMRVRVRASM